MAQPPTHSPPTEKDAPLYGVCELRLEARIHAQILRRNHGPSVTLAVVHTRGGSNLSVTIKSQSIIDYHNKSLYCNRLSRSVEGTARSAPRTPSAAPLIMTDLVGHTVQLAGYAAQGHVLVHLQLVVLTLANSAQTCPPGPPRFFFSPSSLCFDSV